MTSPIRPNHSSHCHLEPTPPAPDAAPAETIEAPATHDTSAPAPRSSAAVELRVGYSPAGGPDFQGIVAKATSDNLEDLVGELVSRAGVAGARHALEMERRNLAERVRLGGERHAVDKSALIDVAQAQVARIEALVPCAVAGCAELARARLAGDRALILQVRERYSGAPDDAQVRSLVDDAAALGRLSESGADPASLEQVEAIVARHPLLADLMMRRETRGDVAAVAQGGAALAAVLGRYADARLDAIAQLEERLAADPEIAFLMPRIVDTYVAESPADVGLALRGRGADRAFDARVRTEVSRVATTALILGGVFFPGAGPFLGVVDVFKHGPGSLGAIDEYRRDDALFDAGMTSSPPSLLHVALEVALLVRGVKHAKHLLPGARH